MHIYTVETTFQNLPIGSFFIFLDDTKCHRKTGENAFCEVTPHGTKSSKQRNYIAEAVVARIITGPEIPTKTYRDLERGEKFRFADESALVTNGFYKWTENAFSEYRPPAGQRTMPAPGIRKSITRIPLNAYPDPRDYPVIVLKDTEPTRRTDLEPVELEAAR